MIHSVFSKKFGEELRFVIADGHGKVIDDAQGYGYKTMQNAHKALWYKFGGGKKKVNKEKQEALEFWKKHKDLRNEIVEVVEYNIKQIAMCEVTEKQILEELCSRYSAPIPSVNYLKYLDK